MPNCPYRFRIRSASLFAPLFSLFPHSQGQNRNQNFLFSVLLLFGLVIGCAAPLANPTGPNSSLIIGRVVINNKFPGPSGVSGTLQIGTIEEFIDIEIESQDGNQTLEATTGEGGYFFLPNIPLGNYYLRKIIIRGEGMSLKETVSIKLPKRAFFSPVPGQIVRAGIYYLDISEKFDPVFKHSPLDPEAVNSYLREKYPNTPWLSEKSVTKRKTITRDDAAPMVLVPAGEFIMGSNDEDDDEKPQRRVYLDGFFIDKYPVTNARFRAAGMSPKDHGPKFNGSGQPVVGVTWHQAKAYCEKVGKRLPTEAEWEKAARGTDGRKYPWGSERNASKLIWAKNSGGKTHPVDRHYMTHEGPYGAVDMLGNVWEWVQDWYRDNDYRNAPNRNPKGPESSGAPIYLPRRVLRGGSWGLNDSDLPRAALRDYAGPSDWNANVGFRCAKASRKNGAGVARYYAKIPLKTESSKLADTPENRRAAGERFWAAIPWEAVTRYMRDYFKKMGVREANPKIILRLKKKLLRKERLIPPMRDAMAQIFTAAEIDAMARYLGSTVGRSILKKVITNTLPMDYTEEEKSALVRFLASPEGKSMRNQNKWKTYERELNAIINREVKRTMKEIHEEEAKKKKV